MKNLLIFYHSLTDRTKSLAEAAHSGACDALEELEVDDFGLNSLNNPINHNGLVSIGFMQAQDVGVNELRTADALLMATPENFGYMSGELKAVFDRTYDAIRLETAGRSYGLIVSSGNDGRGAQASIERIMVGYGMGLARDALIVRGDLNENQLEAAYELGQYMTAALATGLI